jgi:hypothetical protein
MNATEQRLPMSRVVGKAETADEKYCKPNIYSGVVHDLFVHGFLGILLEFLNIFIHSNKQRIDSGPTFKSIRSVHSWNEC